MFRSKSYRVSPGIRGHDFARWVLAAVMLVGSAGVRSAMADNTVTDWNNEFLLITQQTSGNLVSGPPEVAREIAQMGAAMSDAVNAATGSTISSFAYTGGSVANADPNAAAATAAYTALYNIFTDPAWSNSIGSLTTNPALAGNTSNTTLATNTIIPELNSFLTSSLGLTSISQVCATPASSLCAGYNLGIAAANAVDSSATFSTGTTTTGAVGSIVNGLNANKPTGSGTTPGVYIPPSTRPEMLPTWGTAVAPTGITTGQLATAEASIPGPPDLNSTAYANALLQTECEGSSVALSSLPSNVTSACALAGYTQETTDQANAALFWNDPGTTIQPPGHWLQIGDTAMGLKSTSLLQSAQLTALLGEAMNDAGIAAWNSKYTYNLWRPITAIRTCNETGGGITWTWAACDPTWSSLIATPPHPDYVAGHPAFSGAAATVLADYFGSDDITFSSTSDYYCNGGTAAFDPTTKLLVSCTLNAVTYYVSDPDNNGLPDCATIVDGVDSNGSPLICPITETFDSFSAASQGPDGAEYSRVVGGIHTPFAVEDALQLGVTIGQDVSQNAGLPDVIPEPDGVAIFLVGLVTVARLRRRG